MLFIIEFMDKIDLKAYSPRLFTLAKELFGLF
jgi:hypothetical protein